LDSIYLRKFKLGLDLFRTSDRIACRAAETPPRGLARDALSGGEFSDVASGTAGLGRSSAADIFAFSHGSKAGCIAPRTAKPDAPHEAEKHRAKANLDNRPAP
jgi:hypothetical protein